ncbi:MAG TPA: tetratricopeptide repeat protein, partial [Pyrinomonadaceae bacterium]|nr:tetratricopeptide repeat protein [Pyrinomonadaceae bacterium]
FRKNYFTVLLAAALLLIGSSAVFAQTAPVRGKVELVKADGTREPVVGAVVEPFRTDAKGKSPSAKTNKKGEFSFAGLQLGQTFALSISAPKIKPTLQPGIKAGMENVNITVSEGDGKRWSEDEVRQALAAPPSTGTSTTATASTTSPETTDQKPAELTAEQKKAQAEYEAKVKEVTAKNENIKKNSQIIQNALKEGNDAFGSKNYDVAIVKYTEGINAEPDFVGSTPILLNNKGAALKTRATDTYNQAVRSSDQATKAASLTKVKQDLQDAVASYSRSWTILKAAQPADITNQANYESTKLQALTGLTDSYRLLTQTKSDMTKGSEAEAAFTEYFAIETDAAKKAKAQVVLGDILRDSGESEKALAAYQAVLQGTPNNPDALVGAGLMLVNIGYINNDKAKFQEASNYLQKFLSNAPATHPFNDDAKALIDTLKKEQNITPQKSGKGKN